jgi:hypothetical protein
MRRGGRSVSASACAGLKRRFRQLITTMAAVVQEQAGQ